MRSLILAVLLSCTSAGGTLVKAESPLEHVVFLPDVVRGTVGGAYVDTTVVVSNPGPNMADIQIGYGLSAAVDASLPRSLALKPGETAEFKVSGEPFAFGHIKLSASEPFAATGHVQVRASEDSPMLLSEMAVLAQAPVSKCTIPVFVNHPLAENTGIVVWPYYGAYIRLDLYQADGQLIGSKRLDRTPWAPPPPVRMYLTELFPELPDDFHSGCLVVEDTWPTAQSFVAKAVYTRGYSLKAGTVSDVDVPVEFGVLLTTTGNPSAQANELAERYHFTVKSLGYSGSFLALMPLYVARVVAVNPNVRLIAPNAFGYISGGQ